MFMHHTIKFLKENDDNVKKYKILNEKLQNLFSDEERREIFKKLTELKLEKFFINKIIQSEKMLEYCKKRAVSVCKFFSDDKASCRETVDNLLESLSRKNQQNPEKIDFSLRFSTDK